MNAVVVGWDPDREPRSIPLHEQAVVRLQASGRVTGPCRVGEGPVPAVGSTVHLMAQGRVRGLAGRAVVRSSPYLAADPTRPGRMTHYVLAEWDHLLPLEERIEPDELSARVPGVPWAALYGDVHRLDPEAADQLDRVWAAPHPSARPGPVRRALAQLASHAHVPTVPGLPRLPDRAARMLHL